MRRLSVFGATGSVGQSALDLVRRDRDAWQIVVLSANSDVAALARLAREFTPEVAVIGDPARHDELKTALANTHIGVAAGADALVDAARLPADLVLAAIVGTAGLAPTMAAIEAGCDVALANKESLVSAGELMIAAAQRSGATILPADSEHNAIFQCFDFERPERVRRIVLTGSGGPFRDWPAERLVFAMAGGPEALTGSVEGAGDDEGALGRLRWKRQAARQDRP